MSGSERLASFTWWIRKHRNVISGVVSIAFLIAARPRVQGLKIGLLLIAAGESVRVWASGHIHKSSELTTTGPYSLSRNPLYVGSFLLGLGFMAAMGSWWLLAVFLCFFISVYFFTIRAEEGFLSRKFPHEWSQYIGKVPRILPLLRWPKYRPGNFQWSQVARNKELYNIIVILFVYGLLWGKLVFYGG